MALSTSRKGGGRERKVVRGLRYPDGALAKDKPILGGGWVASRTPGSQSEGPIDIMAMKAGMPPLLVQVKATANGPFDGFGPKDRAWLLRMAVQAGGQAVLAWWPYDGTGKLKLIWPEDWPNPTPLNVRHPAYSDF